MGTRVSTPVGSTTSYGSMFETRLISIIGVYHSWDANISLFHCSQKNFTLQAHSCNCSTVQHFLVRTDLITVTHNRIIIFPSPHLTCMGRHWYRSSADSMTCVRKNISECFLKIPLLSTKNMDAKSYGFSVPNPWKPRLLVAQFQIHGHQDFDCSVPNP